MPPACEPRRSYHSSSPISIVTGCSSGSSRARARRIDTSFSRPSCLRYCINGGASRARRAGCLPVSPGFFPATAGSIRVRASCIASFAWQPGVPASPSVSAFIRCGTASPPISWSKRRYSDQPARRSAEDARLARGRCHGRRSRVADIFRHRGPAWRASHAGHVSLGQLKVMSAIERCRTAALGGHVERCEDCAHLRISYNSCGNRHCPKCQAAAAKEWLADRRAELLPVPYFHVVFTLPRPIADIAYHNQAVVYDLLLKTAAETLITIAADPQHLGARIGLTAVLHTWGSTLTQNPHS